MRVAGPVLFRAHGSCGLAYGWQPGEKLDEIFSAYERSLAEFNSAQITIRDREVQCRSTDARGFGRLFDGESKLRPFGGR